MASRLQLALGRLVDGKGNRGFTYSRIRDRMMEMTDSEIRFRMKMMPQIVVLMQANDRYSAGGIDLREMRTISTMLKMMFRSVMAIWRPAAALQRFGPALAHSTRLLSLSLS